MLDISRQLSDTPNMLHFLTLCFKTLMSLRSIFSTSAHVCNCVYIFMEVKEIREDRKFERFLF